MQVSRFYRKIVSKSSLKWFSHSQCMISLLLIRGITIESLYQQFPAIFTMEIRVWRFQNYRDCGYTCNIHKFEIPAMVLKCISYNNKTSLVHFAHSDFTPYTLGGIASISFRFHFQQTLPMHTQGCQGCQKTSNFVRN